MMRTVRAALKVAEREFMVRATSRAFLISNAVLLVVLLIALALPNLFAGDGGSRLGYVPAAERTAQLAEQRASAFGSEIELVPVADAEVARAAVRPPDQRPDAPGDVPEEQLDAVLLARERVVTWEELPSNLEAVLQTASRDATIQSTLAEVDLTAEQRRSLLSPAQLDVESVSTAREATEGPALFVGLGAITVLYGLLIFYGQNIAQGIVEEKSSRVVEVLLSAVRPTALLYGKILGLTALGLAQTVVLAGVGGIAAVTLLDVSLPSEAYGTVALAIAWFILGFLLYAALFAVAASLVSRQEDLQSVMFPAFIPIFAAFFIAQFAVQSPDSTVSLVGGLVPFTAPLVQPLRFGAQVVEPWEVPVAVALCVLTVAVLVPVAARFYTGSVLRFGGRVGLGEAWRGART